MPDDIVPFRPEQLRDKISERIRASFVDLIPEESWKQMVAEQIRHFTSVNKDLGGRNELSPLQQIIRDELSKRFKAQIIAYLDSSEMQEKWQQADNNYGPGKALKEILEGLVPQIVMVQQQNAAMDMIRRIKQSMQS